MLRTLLSLILTLSLFVVLAGCGSDDNGDDTTNGPTPPPPQRVEVTAQDNPGLASVESAVWDSLEAAQIIVGSDADYNTSNFETELIVEMKALVTEDTLLYIWAKWNDSDQDNRFGEIRSSWNAPYVEWFINPGDTIFANEDRLYIMFDNGGTNGADCAKLCHDNASSAGFSMYGGAGDDADIWQWKANRTGIAGLADDMHITDTMFASDPQDQPYDSLYFRNIEDWPKLEPKYMAPGGPDDTTAGLIEGEWVAFDPNLEWMTFYQDGRAPTSKSVPGFAIYHQSRANGSRWDVNTVSKYAVNTWTVVFRRPFNTGDAADIEFDFSTLDSVMVSIGITDNSGIVHNGTKPFPLVFQP